MWQKIKSENAYGSKTTSESTKTALVKLMKVDEMYDGHTKIIFECLILT